MSGEKFKNVKVSKYAWTRLKELSAKTDRHMYELVDEAIDYYYDTVISDMHTHTKISAISTRTKRKIELLKEVLRNFPQVSKDFLEKAIMQELGVTDPRTVHKWIKVLQKFDIIKMHPKNPKIFNVLIVEKSFLKDEKIEEEE